MERLYTSVICLLVSVDRSLCRNGEPMLNNLEALQRLQKLGFQKTDGQIIPGQRGELFRARYWHPQLGITIHYIEEECADVRTWRLERGVHAAA